MPYIKPEERPKYEESISKIEKIFYHLPITQVAGEFTYIVFRLLQRFSGPFYFRALGIGCLICAILEMYRREHGPYEDEKIQENGDIT